jgi:hypothetical protein
MGDLFMSLIHTCELDGVNPFDYLTEPQRHAVESKKTRRSRSLGTTANTLARLATPAAAKYDESCLAGEDGLRPVSIRPHNGPKKR